MCRSKVAFVDVHVREAFLEIDVSNVLRDLETILTVSTTVQTQTLVAWSAPLLSMGLLPTAFAIARSAMVETDARCALGLTMERSATAAPRDISDFRIALTAAQFPPFRARAEALEFLDCPATVFAFVTKITLERHVGTVKQAMQGILIVKTHAFWTVSVVLDAVA